MISAEERHALISQRFERIDRNLTVVEANLAEFEGMAASAAALPWWRYVRRHRAVRAGRRLLAETRALLDVNARMQAKNALDLIAADMELREAL